jgi:seryl-tRNA synthetase
MHCIRQLRLVRTFSTSSYLRNITESKCQESVSDHQHKFHLSKPILNEKFLLDEQNIEIISENTRDRKGVGDIYLVHDINNRLKDQSLSIDARKELENQLHEELKKIPNETHPAVKNYGEDPKVVSYYNSEPVFKHKPLEFAEICKKLNILRTEHLGNFSGHKSYFLLSDLAELVFSSFI